MEEKTILEITQDSVSVKKQNYTTLGGNKYAIGKLSSQGYYNSTKGRTEVQAEVTEPYLSAIMAVWGDTPTVTEVTTQ